MALSMRTANASLPTRTSAKAQVSAASPPVSSKPARRCSTQLYSSDWGTRHSHRNLRARPPTLGVGHMFTNVNTFQLTHTQVQQPRGRKAMVCKADASFLGSPTNLVRL